MSGGADKDENDWQRIGFLNVWKKQRSYVFMYDIGTAVSAIGNAGPGLGSWPSACPGRKIDKM